MQLFKLKDRKDVSMMLAPTHEEEVTTLVADTVKSYKELPVRLYQTSEFLWTCLGAFLTPEQLASTGTRYVRVMACSGDASSS